MEIKKLDIAKNRAVYFIGEGINIDCTASRAEIYVKKPSYLTILGEKERKIKLSEGEGVVIRTRLKNQKSRQKKKKEYIIRREGGFTIKKVGRYYAIVTPEGYEITETQVYCPQCQTITGDTYPLGSWVRCDCGRKIRVWPVWIDFDKNKNAAK